MIVAIIQSTVIVLKLSCEVNILEYPVGESEKMTRRGGKENSEMKKNDGKRMADRKREEKGTERK